MLKNHLKLSQLDSILVRKIRKLHLRYCPDRSPFKIIGKSKFSISINLTILKKLLTFFAPINNNINHHLTQFSQANHVIVFLNYSLELEISRHMQAKYTHMARLYSTLYAYTRHTLYDQTSLVCI